MLYGYRLLELIKKQYSRHCEPQNAKISTSTKEAAGKANLAARLEEENEELNRNLKNVFRRGEYG